MRRVFRVLMGSVVLTCFLLLSSLTEGAEASTPTPTPKPPASIKASAVLTMARSHLGVPYVYGGATAAGFDCSGYVSKVWEIPRHTTDTIAGVVRTISKDELLPGDALNYPLAGKVGHIRIFDKWATADKALVWVYEATDPEVMHRVVPYDPRYIPVRRLNMQNDVPMPPPPPLPADWNKQPRVAPTPVAAPKPPAYINGRVTDEKTGEPLAKVRVFYWSESQQYSIASVVTDKDGKYETPKLVAGTYELAAYANGYDVEFRGELNLRSGGTARFDLQVMPSIGVQSGSRVGSAQAATTVAARDLADPPAALPAEHELSGGRFYTQTAGRDGISGYVISDEGGVKLWTEFQRLGGVSALGYPVSRRFQYKGFTVQATQKGILQWRPELGRAWLTNVFDELSQAGKDDWLLASRSTPRPLDPSFDGGKMWNAVMAGRMALLDSSPPIDRRFEAVSDPLTFFGLPTSKVEDMGNHFAVRLQRAVIQLWKVDVPWAKAGETTVANGGDVAKEAGLLPPEAIAPQRNPRLKQ